jgi:CheY-like chemotaxis protein
MTLNISLQPCAVNFLRVFSRVFAPLRALCAFGFRAPRRRILAPHPPKRVIFATGKVFFETCFVTGAYDIVLLPKVTVIATATAALGIVLPQNYLPKTMEGDMGMAEMMKDYTGNAIQHLESDAAATKHIRAGEPKHNAVFMDHIIGMDGIETARAIREEIDTGCARQIPAIALTANAVAYNEAFFFNHGFQAFLSKPVDILRLDLILRQWIRNSSLEPQLSCEPDFAGAPETDRVLDVADTVSGAPVPAPNPNHSTGFAPHCRFGS